MTKEQAIERLRRIRNSLPSVNHEDLAKKGLSYIARTAAEKQAADAKLDAEAIDVAIEELYRMIGLEK